MRRVLHPLRLGVRQATAVLSVVAARLRAQPGRALLIVGGPAVAVAMLTTAVGGSVEARDRAVQQAISDLPLSQRAFRVDLFNLPFGENYARADATARAALGRLTRAPLLSGTFLRELRVGGGLVQLASVQGLDRIARLESGRLPRSCTPSACEVVQLGPGTRTTWSEGGINLVRVGVVDLPDRGVFGDSLQATAQNNGQRPTVLLAAGAAAFDRLPAFDGIYRAYSWLTPVDPHGIQSWEITALLARESQEQTRLSTISDLYELSGPDAALLDAQSRGRATSARMVLIGGELSALLLGFALVAAMGLRRGLANEQRRLAQRGARRLQLALALAAEISAMTLAGLALGLLGGAVVVAVVAGVLDQPVGGVLSETFWSWTALVATVGAWLAATVAILAVASHPEDGVRRRRIGLLDVAAAGALVAVVLEVARGGLNAETLASGGDPTLMVLLPGLVAFVAAALVARLLSPLMRVLERRSRTAAIPFRLAMLALARARRRTVAICAFLVVSLGLALFASSYRATLAQGAQDEAAFAVPLDFAVTEGSRLVLPLDAAPLRSYDRLGPGDRAFPILRQVGSVPGQGSAAASPAVLGVPAEAISSLHWRSDFSSLSREQIAERLAVHGTVRLRGVRLPSSTRTLTLPVRIEGVALYLALAATDDQGRTVIVPLGNQGPGRHELRVRLPDRVRELDGLEVSLSTAEQYGFSHRDAEAGSSTIASGRMLLGHLRAGGRLLTDWTGWVARGGASLSTTGGERTLRYAFDTGQTVFVRRPQPTDRWPLPVLVSSDLARSLRPDTRFPLDFGDVQLQAQVVGVASRFPDAEQYGEGFVIADESALSTALDARLPGRGDPFELWISAPAAVQARTAAALSSPPFAALQVASRRAMAARLAGDPLARAIEIGLAVSALAALVLTAAGFLVALVSDLRDERGDLFDLEAQGVAPAVLRRQFQIRSIVLVVFGVAGGLILGLVLSRLVVALVQVSVTNTVPAPPLRLVPAWDIGLVAAAILIAVLAVLVELTARRAFAQDLPPRASWSLE
jgi:hypothetical protein